MLEELVRWIVSQVEAWGYLGIFLMMFLESTFFPFPSEVAMIPAGYLAYQGVMDPYVAFLMGALGSLAGAYFNYYLARVLGLPVLLRYGRFVLMRPEKMERAMAMFRRHGEITTFVCRLIPVVRQLISVPAGLAGMRLVRFGFYTGLGAGIWVAVLTGFGWFVGRVLEEAEERPDATVGAAWNSMRRLWNEHELEIYLGIGIPLLLLVVGYALWNRRRAGAEGSGAASSDSSGTPPDGSGAAADGDSLTDRGRAAR